jgi:hypothetical protein
VSILVVRITRREEEEGENRKAVRALFSALSQKDGSPPVEIECVGHLTDFDSSSARIRAFSDRFDAFARS